MLESYRNFFRTVTAKDVLPYQERYGGNPFASCLLVIPTGLGKTDAVLIPWLYAQATRDSATPTRLILVLPRQNLTTQTARNARARVSSAGLGDRVCVLELMAGSDDNRETVRANHPTIIVCTQDMYFSRALNRGYARKPPRWPIDFALYNQDCLIVLDEIQLMADALATSRQLDAFRTRFGTYGDAPCVWMSATVNDDWLRTVDIRESPPRLELNDDDRATPLVQKRIHAPKRIAPAPLECREPKGCGQFLLSNHRKQTRSLVIANTVPRAREIFAAIRSEFPDAVLIHSRFRSEDRKRAAAALEGIVPENGQIVVSTQVLEAGVDITARLLVTDIAPWGSLVQRFGRVNRYGDDADAEIWWVDEPGHSKQKDGSTAPYTAEEVQRAAKRLGEMTSAAPADLPQEDGPAPWQHVLRRADLLDLFDTSSDITGNHMDVSRFIRAAEEREAYMAWREWDGESAPPDTLAELNDEELCPVPLGELREFARKHPVYTWNFATEKWGQIDKDRLYAGMTVVTRASEGGYTAAEGWSPESKIRVEPWQASADEMQGDSSDRKTYQSYTQSLRSHTQRVIEELEVLLTDLAIAPSHAEALRRAAIQHDWGKAHEVFQRTLHKIEDSPELLAKVKGRGRHERKHFRHELASALAMLHNNESDLAAYLAAAHHGKVRLGIRSMPGESETNDRRVARGIQDGDSLPACELASGFSVPALQLSLAVMDFGADGGSWTDRMLRLRDEIGPFRLAYLEMLLRAADDEASAHPNLEAAACLQ